LRLLTIDGSGVYSLSSLMILYRLIAAVNSNALLRPYNYFDIIGSTSTSSLIAIILGYLYITVDKYINTYTTLSDKVFEKKSHYVNIKGKL
ncbi:hypothetical protein B0J18DRAFT_375890, partial [Chaetomium sp. MPI-SDFR-AT-0129]